MKGVMFTLDALFALLIAAAGVSILLYFNYYAQNPSTVPYSNAQAIMYDLLSTPVESIQNSSILAKTMANQFTGANETWPQLMGGVARNSGNPIGPIKPLVSSVFTSANLITTGVVADYGNIYFASNSMLYAVNATTNQPAWSVYTVTNVASTPALYLGTLIFANSANLVALDAGTGATIWSTATSGLAPTSPITAYDNRVLFGATDGYVHAYYANNGMAAWTYSVGGSPTLITVAAGSLAVKTSANQIFLLSQFGTTANQLWSTTPPSPPINGLVSSGNAIYFGTSASANAINIDSAQTSGFPVSAPSAISGVAAYKGYVVYQGSTTINALSPSGARYWSVNPVPSYFGSGVTNATPAVSGSMVYTLWTNGLAGQYLSNGTVAWFAPVSATLPYMALAYGRLYVVSGSRIIAYGSCGVPLHASILTSIATLKLNSQSGCALALSNIAYPAANYSAFVGNASSRSIQIANFDGQTSSVDAGSAVNPVSAVTVAVWVKPNSPPAPGYGTQTFIGKSSHLGDYSLYHIDLSGQAWIAFRLQTIGSAIFSNDAATGLAQGVWYQIVGTYDGNTLKIYKNGVTMNSVSGTGSIGNNGQDLIIGGNPHFSGSIADVQIYNTALSASQVQQLYQSGIAGPPISWNGLVVWYPLGGDTNDYAGFGSGYAVGVNFVAQNSISPSFSNAYSISKASTLLPLLNYSRWTYNAIGAYGVYPVGVYSWT